MTANVVLRIIKFIYLWLNLDMLIDIAPSQNV